MKIIVDVDEAEDRLEELVAIAFNGECVLISQGNDLVQIEPNAERIVPGKVYTAGDFCE
jgi:hypothetical protein